MDSRVREIIDNSRKVVFFGGAGVSTESNIPDFRSEAGLYNAMNDYGYPPEIMLSRPFFMKHTETFYDYYKKNLISDSLVASAIKSSSKELNSTDATNRGIIEPLAQEKIQEALNQKYGDEVVFINKVVIANTDFEESYNQAIADKQTAQLAYEKQQIENKRQIEAAEAEAKVKTTQAKAEADAAVIKAQGEADANKLLNDSITEKILKQQYYDKWDGKLPSVMNSDSSNLILDIGNVTDGTTTAEK